MVPLPLYIATFQPNLLAGWSDYRSELALWLGYGFDSTQWTADEGLELNRHIQEAYRWILYPQSIPGERLPHVWTFMEQTTTLVTAADDYDYTLPSDFGSFSGQYLIWGSGLSYDPPCMTQDTEILHLRAFDERDGKPERFAIRWAAQVAGLNQRREIIMWPTPDAIYTLTYKYAILPGPLSNTNPYPLGGPRVSQLMMEACKAIGETKKNGTRGDQWTVFITSMMAAIQMDKGTNTTPTVGMMRGSPGYANYGTRTSGSPSYYYGPSNSDSSYTLEVV